MIRFTHAQSRQELQQILALQARNLLQCLNEKEKKEQGFLTVVHELSLLEAMNSPYPHTIAKSGDRVVGYALSMLKEFSGAIPVLVPMFDLLDDMEYRGRKLGALNYVVMGQICVEKEFRGQGIFAGMYQHMREALYPHFDLLVTEISTRNGRSLRAHEKVGFISLERYQTETDEWQVVVWDWKQA